MQTTIELAEAIRLAIRRSGHTAQDIAAAMHVSARTVSNWQTGATAPKFDDVVRLAAVTRQPLELFADTIDAGELRTRPGVHTGQTLLFELAAA
jgi:transcriptional regulator with XRE-family HTH domain